jgi:hypothetical protein
MITASLLLKKYLEFSHLKNPDLSQDWGCYIVSKLPDALFVTDNLVAIIEDTEQNANPSRFYADGEYILDSLFHIKIRGIELESTWNKAQSIAESLDSIRYQGIVVDGGQYTIKTCTRQSNLVNTGRDGTGRRYVFNIDYLVALE